jgi:acyl-coenzyme A thioesterase PaaI-like protein
MVPISPFPSGPTSRSYVSGQAAAAERTRVEYFRDPASDHLHAKVWFGPHTEGPPESVHGGAIAAVLDEAMGAVCWMNGHPVVGARITITYVRMTPLGFSGQVEAWIEQIDRRKIFIRSRLTDGNGTLHAEGEALFIELQPELKARFDEARARRESV